MNASDRDIWNILLSINSDRLRSENYFDTPRGSHNYINNKVQQEVDEEVRQFATQFNLSTLYALDMKLNWLIRKCANFIFHEDLMMSRVPVDNIIYHLQSKFRKLQEMLDFEELSSELFETKKVFQQSGQTELLVKRNMARLAMIQKSLEDTIESNSTSPTAKAEHYLKSYLIDNLNHCHNESLIYLLCQKNKNRCLRQKYLPAKTS